MTDERKASETVSDEEIAAAVGEELPDRKAMSTVTTGCGPEEFGIVSDSAVDTIPPGHHEGMPPPPPAEEA